MKKTKWPGTFLKPKLGLGQQSNIRGGGRGGVVRAVASDNSEPGLESSHCQLLLNIFTVN